MNGKVTMNVKAWLKEPGQERRLVIDRHNVMGSSLLGYLHYWSAHVARSQPMSHVGFTYGALEVLRQTTNTAPVLVPTTEDGYFTTGTATLQNTVGSMQTLTALRLLNANSDPVLEWGKLSGLSQEIVVGAELVVTWTLSFRKATDIGANAHAPSVVAFFNLTCSYFYAATTTCPISRITCYANNAASTSALLGEPISGGGITSTSVVWQVSVTAPAGAATMARIDLQNALVVLDSETGRSDSWVATTSAAVTVTMTWTASGSGQINSTPTGAAIWIDTINTGFTTNKLLTPLPVGTYAVVLKKTSYNDYSASLVITDGATTTIDATLVAS
jgi:hypothetical protein